jgi:8-oxo-dGTP pyrophosphatase MutT (NUDIX family)
MSGPTSGAPAVFPVERLDLSFEPKPWPFAAERRAEIDAHFAALKRDKPALWNGRVLLLHRQVVAEGVFCGDYLETDYASFCAWRDWGRPHAGVRDCFGAAALMSGDGAFLLGVMGPHTFNAGKIYFPCGTPEPDDIAGGKVDLEASVRRELAEETGLDAADFTVEPGWTTVVDGALIALVKVLRSEMNAQDLRARILGNLSREEQPELSDIRIVRGPSDYAPAMPRFVTAFLAQIHAGQ